MFISLIVLIYFLYGLKEVIEKMSHGTRPCIVLHSQKGEISAEVWTL